MTLRWDKLRDFTTNDVLDMIYANGLHRYRNSAQESGCLFWTRSVIDLFVRAGLIAQTALRDFDEGVARVKAQTGCWVPEDAGYFYY